MVIYEGINSIGNMFNGEWTLLTLAFALVLSLLSFLMNRKFLQIIQQSSYDGHSYFKWLYREGNIYPSRLMMTSLLSFLSMVLFSIMFCFLNDKIICYLSILFFALFVALYIYGDYKHKDKCALKYTPRMKRLCAIYFVVSFVVSILMIMFINLLFYPFRECVLVAKSRFALLSAMPMLVPFIAVLANLVAKPLESKNNKNYINKCKQKLSANPALIKIGITGSYAKTSVKYILTSILNVKYKVLATPESYNTPMGICKTVNQLDATFDVFIAEMGARHIGDIKELCDIVAPHYGIITGVARQHLETFITLDNIIETKFELAKSLKKGALILSSDNKITAQFKDKITNTKVIMAGLDQENSDVFAQDVKTTKNGSKFTLNFGGKKIKVSTSLLGAHNVSNIVMASAIAFELGLSIEEIAEGISQLKPTPHRLELSTNESGLNIIDDGYNSNEEGADAALEVIKEFGGKKIIVTPGMVELGSEEKAINKSFGEKIAKVCDKVILVKSTTVYDVREGLFEANFDFSNVFMVKSLDEAKDKIKEIAKKGDTVLFENDLPDSFC